MAGSVQKRCIATFQARGQVLYRPGGQSLSFPIEAIFRDANVTVPVSDGLEFASVAPRLGVILSDLPGPPAVDDEVDIPPSPVRLGGTYQIKSKEPDGEGMVELVLQKLPT